MELNTQEQKLKLAIQQQIELFSPTEEHSKRIAALDTIRNLASQLHKSLKDRGHEPRHHRYMIENRGVSPDDHNFYFHIHPIQDLLAFTDDEHANDDPIDNTLNVTFTLPIYTRRHGHNDNYTITRTTTGWTLHANLYSGPCDMSGAPLLFECLRHDMVAYPKDVGDWLEWLWTQAKDKGLDKDAVQKGLLDIAKWIRVTETHAPTTGIWEGLA
jgi:hypothetical protein